MIYCSVWMLNSFNDVDWFSWEHVPSRVSRHRNLCVVNGELFTASAVKLAQETSGRKTINQTPGTLCSKHLQFACGRWNSFLVTCFEWASQQLTSFTSEIYCQHLWNWNKGSCFCCLTAKPLYEALVAIWNRCTVSSSQLLSIVAQFSNWNCNRLQHVQLALFCCLWGQLEIGSSANRGQERQSHPVSRESNNICLTLSSQFNIVILAVSSLSLMRA